MDNHFGPVNLRSGHHYIPTRIQPGHRKSPYPNPLHHRSQSDQEVGRDSLGSDCSVPGMVEDHGSDVSVEDDYQYPGTEMWETFWQMRMSNRASKSPRDPAFLNAPIALSYNPAQDQDAVVDGLRACREQAQDNRESSYTPTSQRPRAAKHLPRASYSIFPRPCPTAPPPVPSFSRPLFTNAAAPQPANRLSSHAPQPSSSRNTATVARDPPPPLPTLQHPRQVAPTIRTVPPTLESPVIPFPALPCELTGRSSCHKPLPEPPLEPRTANRRPSLVNLRKLSLSKLSTNSTPSLAHAAKMQAQPRPTTLPIPAQLPPRAPTLGPGPGPGPERRLQSPRPLPPLPQPEAAPQPPTVSVFDFDDSDVETLGGGPPRRLARRLMRSLANHNFPLRRDKTSHQRSASDGPVLTPPRPPKAHGGRVRAGTVGDCRPVSSRGS